jgi:hypothetical protein
MLPVSTNPSKIGWPSCWPTSIATTNPITRTVVTVPSDDLRSIGVSRRCRVDALIYATVRYMQFGAELGTLTGLRRTGASTPTSTVL